MCFCFIARRAFANFLYFHLISLEKFYFKLWGEMCHILKSCSHLPTVIIFSRCLEISKNSKHLASSPRIPPGQGCVVFGALRNPPQSQTAAGKSSPSLSLSAADPEKGKRPLPAGSRRAAAQARAEPRPRPPLGATRTETPPPQNRLVLAGSLAVWQSGNLAVRRVREGRNTGCWVHSALRAFICCEGRPAASTPPLTQGALWARWSHTRCPLPRTSQGPATWPSPGCGAAAKPALSPGIEPSHRCFKKI